MRELELLYHLGRQEADGGAAHKEVGEKSWMRGCFSSSINLLLMRVAKGGKQL